MSETERQIRDKQARAIEALLREPTRKAAAKAAKIGESTLQRWLTEPEFSQAYREARAQLLEGTLTMLQASAVDAVTTLREICTNKKAPVACRLGAARSIVELAIKAREVLEVEERLRIIEETLRVKGSKL